MTLLLLATLIGFQSEPASSTSSQRAFDEGQRLLQTAQATDLFANESMDGGGAIVLRHRASGFRCVLNPGKAVNAVTVYPSPGRGDDVSCTSETITDFRTLYFTRTEASLEDHVASAAAAIRGRYTGAQPVNLAGSPPMVMASDMDIPPHVSIGFDTRATYEQATLGASTAGASNSASRRKGGDRVIAVSWNRSG